MKRAKYQTKSRLIVILKGKDTNKGDPDEYIKKVFGRNFEFSEKYLTSNINSETIVRAIK